MVLTMVACSGGTTTTETPSQPDAPTTQAPETDTPVEEVKPTTDEIPSLDFKVGLSINATANANNRKIFYGLQDALKASGVSEANINATNANGYATQQASDIENLIQQGAEVLFALNGDIGGLRNILEEACANGVKVISWDTGWCTGMSALMQQNDFALASEIYMLIAGEMGFQGEIITTSHQDHPGVRSRRYTQLAILSEYQDIVEVNHVNTGYPGSTELAYKGVDSALQANPNVTGIWCSFDLEGLGALQAVKERGLEDQIKIVGTDAELDALYAIRDGDTYIASACADYDWGCQKGAEIAQRLMDGQAVQKYYAIPVTIITKDNVDQFIEEALASLEETT